MNRKYIIKAIITLFYSVVCIPYIYAQDTTRINNIQNLPTFSITEKLEEMYSSINTHQLDSHIIKNNSTNNLATILSKNSGVTIRSYGVTGLSSISMRGGNANHTAVLWNGFNLQDPLNGGYNFSSSNVNFIDDIQIQYGGGSSAYGSGAIGGVIHLNNTPVFNNKYAGSIQYKIGSFGFNSLDAKIGSSNNKISSNLRIFIKSSENNFEFINNAKIGNPTEEYKNANMKQKGLLYEFYYKRKENQLISSQFWFQNNFREIPPSTSALNEGEEEYMKDSWYRWALNWNKIGDKITYNARTGIFYTKSNYVNSLIGLNTTHSSIRNTSEMVATGNFFKNHKVTLGINNNYTVGVSDNFSNPPSLNVTALYLSNNFSVLKKIKLNLNLRSENNNTKIKPPTYSINAKYNFYRNYYLTSSFSKNYRSPTFNDLFWKGSGASGNINLKDEYGYSKDIRLELKKINTKVSIKSSVSFFHNQINNQIQWIPEGQVWTPKNVKLVETKGVELMFASTFKLFNYWKLFFNLSYSYTDAQIKEKAVTESPAILGKQLIYIPFYQSNATVGINFKNISFNINTQYIGCQFSRADNIDWIDAYLLTDIGANYKLKLKKIAVVVSAQVNNVFNTTYEARQWYPMPGTNYEIGIKTSIK